MPLSEYRVDMGFGVKQDGTFQEDVQDDKESDNSEVAEDETTGVKVLETDHDIECIYPSRTSSPYGYLVVRCAKLFQVYYVYEEEQSGCEMDKVWEVEFRFSREYSRFGQHRCFDFEQECASFVSGTTLGYLCLWNLKDRKLESHLPVRDYKSGKLSPIDKVFYVKEADLIVTFSLSTQSLMCVKGFKEFIPLEYDARTCGNVVTMRRTESLRQLVVGFETCSVAVFSLDTFEQELFVLETHRDCV